MLYNVWLVCVPCRRFAYLRLLNAQHTAAHRTLTSKRRSFDENIHRKIRESQRSKALFAIKSFSDSLSFARKYTVQTCVEKILQRNHRMLTVNIATP